MMSHDWFPAEWSDKYHTLWVGEIIPERPSTEYCPGEGSYRNALIEDNGWNGDNGEGAELARIINSEHDLSAEVASLSAENTRLHMLARDAAGIINGSLDNDKEVHDEAVEIWWCRAKELLAERRG